MTSFTKFEPQQRANIKIRFKVLTVDDFLQLAAGFFNYTTPHGVFTDS